MRVDYHPEPHTCKLPPAESYPVGTVLVCEEIRAYRFNGGSMVPVRCDTEWRRTETMWRRRPRWEPKVYYW